MDWHRKFESLFRAILDYRLKEDAFSRVREYIVHVLPQTPSPYMCMYMYMNENTRLMHIPKAASDFSKVNCLGWDSNPRPPVL